MATINKWQLIKTELKKRPFLAVRLGWSIEDIEKYFAITPSEVEVEKVDRILLHDRLAKSKLLSIELKKIVGHRSAVKISDQIGISDTALRKIIEQPNHTASYDIIFKIEMYLNAIVGYKISIENTGLAANYINSSLNSVSNKVNALSQQLQHLSISIKDLEKYKISKKILANQSFILTSPSQSLSHVIEELLKIKEELANFIELYIKKV